MCSSDLSLFFRLQQARVRLAVFVLFGLLAEIELDDERDPASDPGVAKFADVDITLSIGENEGKTKYEGNDPDEDSLPVYFHNLKWASKLTPTFYVLLSPLRSGLRCP